jgi:hypothetical protein
MRGKATSSNIVEKLGSILLGINLIAGLDGSHITAREEPHDWQQTDCQYGYGYYQLNE